MSTQNFSDPSFSPWRGDFPALQGEGVYLDSAATSHKPEQVIQAVSQLYRESYAPVYRGMYPQAEALTERFEATRRQVARFMGARHAHEIVLTHGATDAFHTFIAAWAEHHLQEGDEVVFTELDHHMVAASWTAFSQKKGAQVKIIPVRDSACWLDLDALDSLITARTKVVTVPVSSNIRGPLARIELDRIVAAARAVGALIIADASQAPAHQSLAPFMEAYDFEVVIWSGHKCFAPSGVGVLYIAERLHHELRPYQYGGGMLAEFSPQGMRYQAMPRLLEAGTRPVEAVIGLGAALDYCAARVDYEQVRLHEARLVSAALDELETIPGILLLGDPEFLRQHGHMVTFAVHGVNAHDIAWYLAERGMGVRAGDHCCQLLHRKLGISGSVRLSFALYNNLDDVIKACSAIREAVRILR